MTTMTTSARDAIAARGELGHCRHCDGPVPCWSPFGDCVAGLSYNTKDRFIRWIRNNRRRGALPPAKKVRN
jgi:hypothetical protein